MTICLPGLNRSGGDIVRPAGRMTTTNILILSQAGPATIAGHVESVFSQPGFLLHAWKRRRFLRNIKDLCVVQSGLHRKHFVLHFLHRLEHRLVYALKKVLVPAVTTEKLPAAL